MAAGRRKKYTRKNLETAVETYFASISRTTAATELVDSGRKDQRGRVIYERVEIENDAGEPIMRTEYIVPPSIIRLCLFLGIDRSTWQNYAEEWPEIANRVKEEIEGYLEEQLLTREKSVQGIIFNLQNNYGWKQKQEVELGEKTRKTVEAGSLGMKEKLALIASVQAEVEEELGS